MLVTREIRARTSTSFSESVTDENLVTIRGIEEEIRAALSFTVNITHGFSRADSVGQDHVTPETYAIRNVVPYPSRSYPRGTLGDPGSRLTPDRAILRSEEFAFPPIYVYEYLSCIFFSSFFFLFNATLRSPKTRSVRNTLSARIRPKIYT